MARILVLVGSPRKHGNTELLADAFIEGAEEAGHTVTQILLRESEVRPCLACDYCQTHEGKCIQKDAFTNEMQDMLYETDVLVLASPVYTYGFTAQMKAFLDRLYTSLGRPYSVKSSVLLGVYGDSRVEIVEPMVDHYRLLAKEARWKDLGVLTVGQVNAKGDIAKTEMLKTAKEMGQQIP